MRRDYLRGMGLIDVIVGIGLMLVVFGALFTALRVAFELSQLAKAKAVATNLLLLGWNICGAFLILLSGSWAERQAEQSPT